MQAHARRRLPALSFYNRTFFGQNKWMETGEVQLVFSSCENIILPVDKKLKAINNLPTTPARLHVLYRHLIIPWRNYVVLYPYHLD
jgi:hypothetical protein